MISLRTRTSAALFFLAVACQPARTSPLGAAATKEASLRDSDSVTPKATTPSSSTRTRSPVIDRATCGLPEELREDDWPRSLKPVQPVEPDPAKPGTLCIAVLPDTQYYASCRESHFPVQGKWLARVAEQRNIIGTIHLGDLTEHNTQSEWDYVRKSLSPLFSKTPLFLATGNHDYGNDGEADMRTSLFSDYFGKPKPKTAPTIAEVMEEGNLENAYYRLELDEATLGVLVLEWSPTNRAVAWAQRAVKKYPEDRKIFVTHAYLFHDGTRYDYVSKGDDQPWNPLAYGTALEDPTRPYSKKNAAKHGAHDGQMLWDDLLSDMPGLFLTLSGHVLGDGTGLLASEGAGGGKVHQVLTNYQMLDEGGLGYLRLVEISPDGASLQMKTYSPSLDKWAVAKDQHFSLPIEPPLF